MSVVITWYSPSPVNITPDVLFANASFTMHTGSSPGDFSINVKDKALTYNFKAGERVTLDIGGIRYFDGYALEVSQSFAFPVIDTTKSYERVRLWTLKGSDVGLLFQRRYIFNQSQPAAALTAFDLPAGSSDLAYLNLIMTHLTVGSDNITTDFHAVASPNPDERGMAISLGDQWANAMRLTATLTGAVWGIRPDRTVYYNDDGSVSAPFAISDEPDDVTSYGYSAYSWTNDGTRLVNDAQIWGVGLGKASLTYDRVEDADSIALHGRWQNTDSWRTDLYVQAHVDAVTESLVYGSPSHLHGPKDDSILVKCRVRQPGLLAGQKVRIISNVFGDEVVLPIRSIATTFVNANEALFDLTATWELDPARSFFDFPPLPGQPGSGQGHHTTTSGTGNCADLTLDVPNLYFDWGQWTLTRSDPMLGFVQVKNGAALFTFLNRKRYAQMSPVTILGFFVERYGDGYGSTKLWALAERDFTVSGNYVIAISFIVPFDQDSPGEHVSPFPQFGGPLGTGPFGTQSNLMKPAKELAVQINGLQYWLLDSNGKVGGGTHGIGAQSPGTLITFEWASNGDARIYASNARPNSPNFTTDDLGGRFTVPETLHPTQLQIYAAMWGNNDWDGTSAGNGAGSGVINDIVTTYPDAGHFFDNDFPLNQDASSTPFKGYYTDDSHGYSVIEDGTGTAIQLTVTLINVPDFSSPPPTCIQPLPQLPSGDIFCEALNRTSDTEYMTSLPFALGSTDVTLNGVNQRVALDYVETQPNTITFRIALPTNAYVYCCYQVQAA